LWQSSWYWGYHRFGEASYLDGAEATASQSSDAECGGTLQDDVDSVVSWWRQLVLQLPRSVNVVKILLLLVTKHPQKLKHHANGLRQLLSATKTMLTKAVDAKLAGLELQ
jgi:hypothetical protein